GERIDHQAVVFRRRGLRGQDGIRGQDRAGRGADDRARALGIHIVADAALGAGHDAGGDLAGEIVDGGRDVAIGEIVHAQGEVDLRERHADVVLRRHRQGREVFVHVLETDGLTGAYGEIHRQANAQLTADLGAGARILVIVLGVDLAHERVRVLPQTNGNACDHRNREQTVSGHYFIHFKLYLNKADKSLTYIGSWLAIRKYSRGGEVSVAITPTDLGTPSRVTVPDWLDSLVKVQYRFFPSAFCRLSQAAAHSFIDRFSS